MDDLQLFASSDGVLWLAYTNEEGSKTEFQMFQEYVDIMLPSCDGKLSWDSSKREIRTER